MHAAPIVVGGVLISTTFITIGEMPYKVILSKPWLVRARLVIN